MPFPTSTRFAGDSTLYGGGASDVSSRLLFPSISGVREGFKGLQGRVRSNQLQDRAIQEQQGSRTRQLDRLADFGQSEQGRIEDAFSSAASTATQGLASRGNVPTDVLERTAQSGVDRETGLAMGDLRDRVTMMEQGVDVSGTKNISDLLFGSSDQATDLISAILGSGAVGQTTTGTTAIPTAGPGPGSRGPGTPTRAPQPGDHLSGGGGASSSGGGGGLFGNDPQSQAGIPLGDQDLEKDRGPKETPEAFERNARRLSEKLAKAQRDSARIFGLGQAAGGQGGINTGDAAAGGTAGAGGGFAGGSGGFAMA